MNYIQSIRHMGSKRNGDRDECLFFFLGNVVME